MKVCRFADDHIGVVVDNNVHDVTNVFDSVPRPGWPYPPQDWLITNFEAMRAQIEKALPDVPVLPLDSITLQSPVANPGKIIGAPVNYAAHIEESQADEQISYSRAIGTLADHGLFIKANSALLGPDGVVQIPFTDRRTDHEVELGVVIGKKGKTIPYASALDYVFGYCVALDITVRGKEFPGFRKSPDTFAVIGPWITTSDQIDDPNNLDLSLRLNGQMRQDSNTRHLIFDVQRLIEYASAMYTLYPGDIIMSGTPAGVGPVAPNDQIVATVQGLGELAIQVGTQSDRADLL